MTLAEDFEDFIRLLNTYKVEYMVVGDHTGKKLEDKSDRSDDAPDDKR